MADDGDEVLADWIGRLERFGDEGPELSAKEARPLVQAEAQRTAAAGTDPYGKAWPLRKDGQRAIPNAASAVDVIARGKVLVTRVYRGAAIQNFLPEAHRRQVIPDAYRPLPEGYVAALREGASRAFRKLVGG